MAEEDVIFGHKRHLYGGLAPSKMIDIRSSKINDTVVKISCVLPKDTVVDSQTMCSVAGAIIIKNYDHPPKNEFDGYKVGEIAKDGAILDESYVTDEGYVEGFPCYYAAFPYSDQGVYGRYGDVTIVDPIPDLKEFKVSRTFEDGVVNIQAKFDKGAYAGLAIFKTDSAYILDPTSTTPLIDVEPQIHNAKYVYPETIIENGITYHYSAFPYLETEYTDDDDQIVTKRAYGIGRFSEILSNEDYFYGYDIELNNPDPDARVTYPADVDNADYVPAYLSPETVGNGMDTYSSGFIYNSWEIPAGNHFMPRPCLMHNNGEIEYYLNPDNYNQKEDGTDSHISDSDLDENLQAMMEWPLIYTKRWSDKDSDGNDIVYHFRCSNRKLDDDYDCWTNYLQDNTIVDHFYTSIYVGVKWTDSNGTDTLRSYSNPNQKIDYWDVGFNTFSEHTSMAKANGDRWNIDTITDRLLINDLLVLISKSTDASSKFGSGLSSGDSNSWDRSLCNGIENDKGIFGGLINSDSFWTPFRKPVKVFGMENYWNFFGTHVVGCAMNSLGELRFKFTRGTHDGSESNDYTYSLENGDQLCDGYISVEVSDLVNGEVQDLGGYSLVFPQGRFPCSSGGTSSTYESDRLSLLDIPGNSSLYDSALHIGGMVNGGLQQAQGPFSIRFTSKQYIGYQSSFARLTYR